MRFGHGEGFNGACVTRFKLVKTKGHYRTKAKAELHTLIVFCAMHGITAYRTKWTRAHSEPPLPQVAHLPAEKSRASPQPPKSSNRRPGQLSESEGLPATAHAS